MKIFTLFIRTIPLTLFLLKFAIINAQTDGYGKVETFTNSNAVATYSSNYFIGDNGIKWTYNYSRSEGDYSIDGKGLMFGNASESFLESDSITGGIGSFEIKMRKAFTGTGERKLELYINNELKGTSAGFGSSSGSDETIYIFSVENINIIGNFIMKIKPAGNTTTNRQVTIDDIKWIKYDNSAPKLRIIYPDNGTIINNNSIQVEFITENFTTSGNNSDGKIAYRLNENETNNYITSSPALISGLSEGSNTIYFELTDNYKQPLIPPVKTEVTIIYNVPTPEQPILTIIEPKNNAIIYSQNVNIIFDIKNFIFENDGQVRYTLDHGHIEYTTEKIIYLTGLFYGEHTITLELVTMDNFPYPPDDPVIIDIVFTCLKPNIVNYKLIKSEEDIINGSKYLISGIKDNSYYALGWQKPSNRNAVEINENNGIISVIPAVTITEEQDNIYPYEIMIEKNNGNYILKDVINEKSIAPANNTSCTNMLRLDNDNRVWAISFGEGSIAEITCIGTNSNFCADVNGPRNTIQFNSSSNLFNCYAGTSQKPVFLYKAFTEPHLRIASPVNNLITKENIIEIEFEVFNFEAGIESGKINYYLNNNLLGHAFSSPITILGLPEGENSIYLELRNNDNSTLIPTVGQEIIIIYKSEEFSNPELIIMKPEQNAVIYSKNVDIICELKDFVPGVDGKIKYNIDNSDYLYSTETKISFTGLEYGEHIINMELVTLDNPPISLVDPVFTSVTFTCIEPIPAIYRLIKSDEELEDDEKYIFVGKKDENHYAMGWQKPGNRHAVPVNIKNNIISIVPALEITPEQDNENPYEIILKKNKTGWRLYDIINNKYLRPATGNNNGLVLNDENSIWNISISDSGVSSLICIEAGDGTTFTRNNLRFNKNGTNPPLFSCYASASQNDIYIYKNLTTPIIVINSPENNIKTNLSEITIEISVYNFILEIDGYVEFNIESAYSATTTSQTINIPDLSPGANKITLELKDKNNTSLNPRVIEELIVIYEPIIPTLNIKKPLDGETINFSYVDVEFEIENFSLGIDGYIKYIFDEESGKFTTDNPILLDEIDFGNHTIMLELVDTDKQSLNPSIISSVNFNVNNLYDNILYFEDLKIFPNPASSFLNINMNYPANKILITNALEQPIGEIISDSKTQKIDISYLNQGIYFLKIYRNNCFTVHKFIKK